MNNYLSGFETDRLIIRKLTRKDISVWAEFFQDKSSFDYIGLEDDKEACEHSELWMERQFKRYQDGDYGLMALIEKESMKLVGQCGLITMNVKQARELEIGYHIIEQFRGKGYAREAALVMRDFVFENDLADTIITVININNEYSMKVTEKLGLKQTEEIICMDKRSYLYSLSKEDWLTSFSPGIS